MKISKKITAVTLAAIFTLSFGACSSNTSANTANNNNNTNTNTETPMEEMDTEDLVNFKTMSALDAIYGLYSAKVFTDEEISEEQIQIILESGQHAPSARNLQPWHFTVVKNNTVLEALGQGQASNGTVGFVISGVSEPEEGVDVSFDCALATQNMALGAYAVGLGAHIYTGSIAGMSDETLDSLELPDGYSPVAFLLVGYVENEADAISSASTRNELTQMVNYVQ